MALYADNNESSRRARFYSAVEAWADQDTADRWLEEIDERGYLIIPEVMTQPEVEAQRAALAPLIAEGPHGRNVFEGTKTNRIYAMLDKSPVFADMVGHPVPLAFAEYFLGPSCLLSACLAINLTPGESAQPWHTDDGHITVPTPHDVFGISTFWALEDTTENNGATELLPGSHKWAVQDFPGVLVDQDFADASEPDPDTDPGYHPDAVKALMPAGSLMIARSDLWHRGGANRSEGSRLVVTPQYCAGWARPLETMLLAVKPERAAKLPKRIQELLGYSIHPPFMGYVDGVHPQKVLVD